MRTTLIGCVTYSKKRYCQPSFLRALRAIEGDHDVLIIDNSDDGEYARSWTSLGFETLRSPPLPIPQLRQAKAYRRLRREFLRRGHAHLLALEQDIIPPPNVLDRLLRHDQPVVGGLYFIGRGQAGTPCVIVGTDQPLGVAARPPFIVPDARVVVSTAQARRAAEQLRGHTVFTYDAAPEQKLRGAGLIPVFAMGLGCVLIGRSVLMRIDFRVQLDFDGEVHGFCDMAFHDDCRRRGIPVFLDASLRCRHLFPRTRARKTDSRGSRSPGATGA